MKVLITGANGNLAIGLTSLVEGRHALRLSDLRPVPPQFDRHAFVPADVRRPEELLRAVAGVDVVVHTPAWHGMHVREMADRDAAGDAVWLDGGP